MAKSRGKSRQQPKGKSTAKLQQIEQRREKKTAKRSTDARLRRQTRSREKHEAKARSSSKTRLRRFRKGRAYPRYFNHQLRISYLITRRCLNRAFRLPPNDPTRKLFEYFLAYAAKRYKIAINAVVIMSNHYHLVISVTRWNSNISGFMHCLNLNTSLVLNARQRKRGPLYEVEPFDIRPLATKEDILRAMAYTTLNPIKAGLVENPEEWPGLVSTFEDYDKLREIVERPEFFGNSSKKPKEIQLELLPPPAFGKLSRQEFQALFQEHCNNDLEQIHQYRAEAGLGYLGLEALQNQSVDDRPTSPDIDREQLAEEENATSYGTFKSNTAEEEAYKACEDAFRKRHRECIERVKAGKRPKFPYGTEKMVRIYGFPMKPRTSKAKTPVLHHFPELALE